MTLEDDINDFKLWSLHTGCPPKIIPSEETLRKLFRSPQSLVLRDITNKVKPWQKCEEIRQNIFISQMKNIKSGSLNSLSNRYALPTEAKQFLKIERLKEKITETDEQIEKSKIACDKNKKIVFDSNLKIAKLQQILSNAEIRACIFLAKNDQLLEAIAIENDIKKHVSQIIPTKFDGNIDSGETDAQVAFNECSRELKNFYELQNTDSAVYAKNAIWQKIRQIFENIPNILMWNIITQYQDNLLNRVLSLTDLNSTKSITLTNLSLRSEFNIALHCAYGKMVALKIDQKIAEKKLTKLRDNYGVHYIDYLNNFKTKFQLFCDDTTYEYDDTFLENYITQKMSIAYQKIQLIYQQDIINCNREKLTKQMDQLKSHQIIKKSLCQIYDELERTYVRLRDDIISLELIDEKSRYLDNYMKYLIQDVFHQNAQKQKNINATNTTTMLNDNTTIVDTICENNRYCWGDSTVSSFNSTSSSSSKNKVLCSTKLEFGDGDLIIQRPKRLNLPRHIDEMSAFVNISFNKLTKMTSENFLSLASNTLEIDENLSINNSSAHIQTPKTILNDARNRLNFLEQLKSFSELKTNLFLPQVDETSLHEQIIAHDDKIFETCQRLATVNTMIQQTYQDSRKYYEFLINDPLRAFVPKTKEYNNRSFEEYAHEYNMYYKLLENNKTGN